VSETDLLRQRVLARLEEQRQLVQALLALREQLPGSLFARYGVCGKPSCACQLGHKHGPYYVLSTRSGGRGGFAYLESKQVREARTLVARFREFRRGLARLRKLNEELVGLLKRYQSAQARRAGARVGLSPSA
jgi:hypothetical protein